MNAETRLTNVINSPIERAVNAKPVPYAKLHTYSPVKDPKTEEKHRTQRVEHGVSEITETNKVEQVVGPMNKSEGGQEKRQAQQPLTPHPHSIRHIQRPNGRNDHEEKVQKIQHH